MRVTVFGSGGVGGLFGGFLAKAGKEVDFVARGKQFTALKESGLRVKTPHGDFHLPCVSVYETAADLAKEKGKSDLILVCVKSWQLESCIPDLKSIVGPDTLIVPLENGLTSTELLLSVFKESAQASSVLPGLCYGYYHIGEPGQIIHIDPLAKLVFGELSGLRTDRAMKVLGSLTAPEIETVLATNIDSNINIEQWKKFILISSAGVVSSLCRAPILDMMRLPVRKLLELAMKEVESLARAKGVDVPVDVVERSMALLDKSHPHATTSMQRDFEAKRRTELETFSGYIVREAEKLQSSIPILVPVHQWCYVFLMPQEILAQKK